MGIGSRLGAYHLRGLLGEGGTAWVFLAEGGDAGHQVAIKVLKPSMAADPGQVLRFTREAHLGRTIASSHIMRVLDHGQAAGLHYMVLELLCGVGFASALKVKRCLPWPQAVALMTQIARGLRDLHRAAIIHRDIKPGNLFVSRGGQLKIMDLGLAKRLGGGDDEDPDSGTYTVAGTAIGTPAYMAPEQVSDAATAGCEADVYGLCATLFHTLMGHPPFVDHNPCAVLHRVLNQPLRLDPADHPQWPRALVDLLNAGLDKSPLRRPADGAELTRLLQAIHESSGATTRWSTRSHQRDTTRYAASG